MNYLKALIFLALISTSRGDEARLMLSRAVESKAELGTPENFAPTLLELSSIFPDNYQRLALVQTNDLRVLVVLSPDGLIHTYAAGLAEGGAQTESLEYTDEFMALNGRQVTANRALGKYVHERNPMLQSVLKKDEGTIKKISKMTSLGFVTQALPETWPENAQAIRVRFHRKGMVGSTANSILEVLLDKSLVSRNQ